VLSIEARLTPYSRPFLSFPPRVQLTAANPVLTPAELAHILTLSQPSVIVTTAAGVANFQHANELLSPELQAKLGYATKGNVFIVNQDADDYGASPLSLKPPHGNLGGWTVRDWKVLLAPDAKPFSPPKYVGSEDSLRAAMIFWSSGTSGKSKGVILTHKAIGTALIAVWHASTLGNDERIIGLPPFYHIVRLPSQSLAFPLCFSFVSSPYNAYLLTFSRLTVRMGERPHGRSRVRFHCDDDDQGAVPRSYAID
jgi:acyl-CoA synthetase (AMP-forming)/AMP-acid ligase II